MELKRLNATVLATEDSLLEVEVTPTRSLNYNMLSHTTGIADLEYDVASSHYDLEIGDYPSLLKGNERYYGDYEMQMRIGINASFDNFTAEQEWLKG
jgi:hypothetical protein